MKGGLKVHIQSLSRPWLAWRAAQRTAKLYSYRGRAGAWPLWAAVRVISPAPGAAGALAAAGGAANDTFRPFIINHTALHVRELRSKGARPAIGRRKEFNKNCCAVCTV